MNLRVDPLNNGHQVVKYVFGVVHGGIHEVPDTEDEIENISVFRSSRREAGREKPIF